MWRVAGMPGLPHHGHERDALGLDAGAGQLLIHLSLEVQKTGRPN
jgi:hypothetical protein